MNQLFHLRNKLESEGVLDFSALTKALVLRVSSKGLILAGLSEDKQFSWLHEYLFDLSLAKEEWVEQLDYIFDPLMKKRCSEVEYIHLLDGRYDSLNTPEEYQDQELELSLTSFFSEGSIQLTKKELVAINSITLICEDSIFIEYLSNLFPSAKLSQYSILDSLKKWEGKNTNAADGVIAVHFLFGNAWITCKRNNVLLLASKFDVNTPEELSYFLVAAANAANLSLELATVLVSGEIPKLSHFHKAVSEYASHVQTVVPDISIIPKGTFPGDFAPYADVCYLEF